MSRWEYFLAFFPVGILMLAGILTRGADGWIILGIAFIFMNLQVQDVERRERRRSGRVEYYIFPPARSQREAGDR